MTIDTIKVAKMLPGAKLPSRKHPQDAGMDFYAAEAVSISPHSFGIVHTGITVEIPAGYVGLMMPKSRSDFLLGAGVIDAGYQGEIMVKVVNPASNALTIGVGDPICQMLLIPVLTPAVVAVDWVIIHQEKSPRGKSGGIVSQDNSGE
jgi:dUTP pyrophosphatase